jgi:hypothetical protein
MWLISSLAYNLLAAQEGICSRELAVLCIRLKSNFIYYTEYLTYLCLDFSIVSFLCALMSVTPSSGSLHQDLNIIKIQ